MEDMFGDNSHVHRVVSKLVGETVTVYVEDYSFTGRIADSRSSLLIMAERRAPDSGSGGRAGVVITYIPYEKIQAITEF